MKEAREEWTRESIFIPAIQLTAILWSRELDMERALGHSWGWLRGSPVSRHGQTSSGMKRNQETISTSSQKARSSWQGSTSSQEMHIG
jgi:hypothetical protein